LRSKIEQIFISTKQAVAAKNRAPRADVSRAPASAAKMWINKNARALLT
jgi:hypothetical protein